jgi:hypothetical protein
MGGPYEASQVLRNLSLAHHGDLGLDHLWASVDLQYAVPFCHRGWGDFGCAGSLTQWHLWRLRGVGEVAEPQQTL